MHVDGTAASLLVLTAVLEMSDLVTNCLTPVHVGCELCVQVYVVLGEVPIRVVAALPDKFRQYLLFASYCVTVLRNVSSL